ncbi:MAG: Holliday junction resolvase RuvX [Gammaproteobacteria bacterium]|nr:Holliday junction resolvase RuvX [Gammaproteobacteria bacterium]
MSRTLLGFDFGRNRIGVAVGQEVTCTVTPLLTLLGKNQKPDWSGISRLIEEWQPELLVVGLPLQEDGGEQDMSKAARRFGNQLKGRYNLPVELVDERYSSLEANMLLREKQAPRVKKSMPQYNDHIAAQLILQSWMDAQVHRGSD